MILGFQEVEASQVNAWLREGVERSDPVMESPDGPERWCFFGGSWHRVEEGVHVSGDECRPA